MADSTLDVTGETPPVTGKGHGTGALGPSDSSDSGSDIVGGHGLRGGGGDADLAEGLDRGTTEDPDSGGTRTAGPDIGDANLDSDSDSAGTGERASAGRDTTTADAPEAIDTVITPPDDELSDDSR